MYNDTFSNVSFIVFHTDIVKGFNCTCLLNLFNSRPQISILRKGLRMFVVNGYLTLHDINIMSFYSPAFNLISLMIHVDSGRVPHCDRQCTEPIGKLFGNGCALNLISACPAICAQIARHKCFLIRLWCAI